MAVIQISRIQHRRGPIADLPKGTASNPVGLKEGEIGFSSDTGQMFIGSPNLPQIQGRKPSDDNPTGKFPFANTQVLTEWSRNSEELIRYQYRYRRSLGNSDFPGPGSSLDWAFDQAKPWTTENTPIFRQLQERLDEMVSVKSYGAVGDGITDDTYAIWRAALDSVQEHYEETTDGTFKTAHRRLLYFPAGTYVISRPAILPPFSTWVGDGIGKTVIILQTASNSWDSACVVETVDDGLMLDDLLTNWTLQVPAHLGRTEYQIGSAVPNTSRNGNVPTNIYVEGITFKHAGHTQQNPSRDIVRLNRASQTMWVNCRFEGSQYSSSKTRVAYLNSVNRLAINQGTGGGSCTYNAQTTGSSRPDSIAVFIDGLGDVVDPKDHHFLGCQFHNTTYAFSMTDQVSHLVVDGCSFDTHYRAFSIGEDILEDAANNRSKGLHTLIDDATLMPGMVNGPYDVRVTNSNFRNILAEAVFVNKGSGIVSAFNTYEDTIGRGDGFNTANSASSPVIYFGTTANNCVCIGDWFGRSDVTVGATPATQRVLYDPLHNHLVVTTQDSPTIPNLATKILRVTIAASPDPTEIIDTDILLNISANENFVLEYSLADTSSPTKPRRIGDMAVVASYDAGTPANSPVVVSDTVKGEFLETGVVFSHKLVTIGTDTFVRLCYKNASNNSYLMSFTIKKWKVA